MPGHPPSEFVFHPFIQKLVDELLSASPFLELDAQSMRRMNNPLSRSIFGPPEDVALAEDRQAENDGLTVPVRVYEPAGAISGTLLFMHGGGFVVGDVATYGAVCRAVANCAGCRVVSVEYRLAPEHPFPAAVHDAYAAAAWTARTFPGPLAVGGDSAGGTLAIAVCLLAKERGSPKIALQALAYPACDLSSFSSGSYAKYGHGLFLTTRIMAFFRDSWLPDPDGRVNPLASPLLARDLSGLPPCLILAAEYDLLLDDGARYAQRLQAAGVPCTRTVYPGTIHGFFAMHPMGKRDNGLEEFGAALRETFSRLSK